MMGIASMVTGCFPLPQGPCPIDTLLIDETALPIGELKETGGRSADDAPARVGIEKIGTSFSSFDQGGLVYAVYRFWNADGAKEEFEHVALSYFMSREDETDWTTPIDLMSLPIQAGIYKIACTTIKGKEVEVCQFVAQYDVYAPYLSADMIALDHNDLLFIIKDIDRRFVSCLAER